MEIYFRELPKPSVSDLKAVPEAVVVNALKSPYNDMDSPKELWDYHEFCWKCGVYANQPLHFKAN